jgi:hypothetical protein
LRWILLGNPQKNKGLASNAQPLAAKKLLADRFLEALTSGERRNRLGGDLDLLAVD